MHSRHLQARPGLASIRAFFERPAIQHLGLELAVCWVLERLLQTDTYPTALMHDLSACHPKLRLSETVLQQALGFLDQEGAIASYAQRCPSRGRPGSATPHVAPPGDPSPGSRAVDAAVARLAGGE